MEKTLAAPDLGRRVDEVLDDVAGNGRRSVYLVERDGQPVAAVVPIAIYEQWKRDRDAFFARMDAAAQRANLSPDEADRLADEAVRWARGQL